jgi:hypothetical protein
MTVQTPFTLYQSALATVRVEPIDRVILEQPGAAPIVARKSSIRDASGMQVRYYRAHVDPAYAGKDDDIVVRFHAEGTSPLVLGPFPHAEGIAISDALKLARRHVLFAAPGFSASVDEGSCSIVVATRGVTAPIPTYTSDTSHDGTPMLTSQS